MKQQNLWEQMPGIDWEMDWEIKNFFRDLEEKIIKALRDSGKNKNGENNSLTFQRICHIIKAEDDNVLSAITELEHINQAIINKGFKEICPQSAQPVYLPLFALV